MHGPRTQAYGELAIYDGAKVLLGPKTYSCGETNYLLKSLKVDPATQGRTSRLKAFWNMRAEVRKTPLPVRGDVQQGFEGLLWGPRAQNPRPTFRLAQGPSRGGQSSQIVGLRVLALLRPEPRTHLSSAHLV